MANRRGTLGRGLGALLGNQALDFINSQQRDVVEEIFVRKIRPNPYQARRAFDPEAMKDLVESIKVYGILQPIIIRKLDEENYQIIAGERRLNAARKLGLEKIPAIVREYTDAQMNEVSLIENVQREDLSVLEEAGAYERLIREFGYTQENLAAKIGRSRSHIANLLRLLKLSPKVREMVAAGKISMGQARPLLAIEDESMQVNVAEMVISEDLSVRKVEAFVKELRNSGLIPPEKPSAQTYAIAPSKRARSEMVSASYENSRPKISPYERRFRDAEKKLGGMLGAQIKIVEDGENHQIQISFADEGELLKIIRNLERVFANPSANAGDKVAASREEKISALRKFSTEGVIV